MKARMALKFVTLNHVLWIYLPSPVSKPACCCYSFQADCDYCYRHPGVLWSTRFTFSQSNSVIFCIWKQSTK